MNTEEFVQNTVSRTLSKYDERFSTVAESGSYDDLSDKPTIPEAYDDTALAARVTAVEDGKASLQVAAIPGGGGGEEINALVSQGENSVSVSYYKDGALPNTLNLNVDSDYFSIPTTGYVDTEVAKKGNAKITFDNEYQYLQIRDNNGTDIGFSQETANTVRVQEYAKDDRGQVHAVFDETLASKTYVDGALADKQDTLTSGTNIKSINGESILGSGNMKVTPMADYEVCIRDEVGSGNVVQIGTIKEGEDQQNLYQFFYRTDALANATVKTHPFVNLLADYTINDFIDATGMTSNGIFIGNGRTDNDNRLVVQQFSKNNKNIQIRTYKDFSGETALIKVIFKGKKTV